jgi:hypothetical protein
VALPGSVAGIVQRDGIAGGSGHDCERGVAGGLQPDVGGDGDARLGGGASVIGFA